MERVQRLRIDAFADDVAIDEAMCAWSESYLAAFFELGGEHQQPPSPRVQPDAGVDRISETEDALADLELAMPPTLPAPATTVNR